MRRLSAWFDWGAALGEAPTGVSVRYGAAVGGTLEPGAIVGERFRLESVIGAGGMGVVWLATHRVLGRQVALKQIPLSVPGGEDPDLVRKRTASEGRNAEQLRGENHVVAIGDVFEDPHNVWLVLEYVPSLNLQELVQARGHLEPGEVAWIGERIARALTAGHERGIVHRDVKPGNVLIGRDGEQVKLGDFGISRRRSDPHLTQTGSFVGTLLYSATEIARGEESSPESDVFSLGATLYYAVEGRPPFRVADGNQQQLAIVAHGVIEEMRSAGDLGPLLERLLQPDPDTRPDADTAAELLHELANAGGLSDRTRETLQSHEPVRSTMLRTAFNERTPDTKRDDGTTRNTNMDSGRVRRVLPAVATAAVLLAAVVGVVALSNRYPPSTPAPTSSPSSSPSAARQETVLNTVPIGLEPHGVAVTPDGRRAFVSNSGANTVSVIDIRNSSVTAVIPVGQDPAGVAISPDGQRAYVANLDSAEVSVIDTATYAVIATVPVGNSPIDMALTPDGRFLYVTNFLSSNLSVIDTARNSVAATVVVDPQPTGVVVDSDGRWGYVASNSGTISMINIASNEVRSEKFLGDEPRDLAISPDGKILYLTNADSHTLSFIDTSTGSVANMVPVDNGRPFGVALTPDGRWAYITNSDVGTLSVVDTAKASAVATLTVGKAPFGVAVAPDGQRAFVVNMGSGTVSVIDIAQR